MKRITGRLAEDKGKYYAVINLPAVDGKRKTKWHTLNLEAKKGNKKEASTVSIKFLISITRATFISQRR